MATTKIKKAEEYKLDIKLNSKDTTYVFTNEEAGKGAKLQFSTTTAYTYSLAKQGNDLFIITNFVDTKKDGYKVILTTIKDYFKYNEENTSLVTVDEELPTSISATYITKESTDTLQGENIVGDKGKTDHIIKNVGVEGGTVAHKDYVNDLGGNDTYTITTYHDTHYNKTAEVHIIDWAGKDKYYITHNENDGEYSAYFDISDMKGNDTYSVTDYKPSQQSTIYEDRGNDKYKLLNSINIAVLDDYGKDKYNLTGAYKMELTDINGNDKYEILNSMNVSVYDGNDGTQQGGKDKYIVSGTNGLLIDEGHGNDKYTLTTVSNEGYDTDYYYVWDSDGKDKYIVTDAHYMNFTDEKGNDKWTISKSDNLSVSDRLGNDKWKVSESKESDLYDNDGKDSWKISDSTNVRIQDGKGKDKYSIISSTARITDSEGKDTYKVSKSEKVTILDNDTQSDDTYKVDNLNGVIVINDKGGAKDKLTISSLKAKDVIYMADFQANKNGVVDGALYLLDKTKTGYTCIGNYFKTKDEGGIRVFDVTQDGDGRIETVKAAKKNITAKIDDFSYTPTLLELSETVAGWLTYNTFGSVNELLTSGTDEQVQNFIAYIQNPQV